MHPLNVPQQGLVEVLLDLRLDVADALQQHVDHIVSYFHGACMAKAGHESMPDQVGMRPQRLPALRALTPQAPCNGCIRLRPRSRPCVGLALEIIRQLTRVLFRVG
jgi:hypothetical protein